MEDYFHYDDWKVKMQDTFDNFNLLVIPNKKQEVKLFFDLDNFKRRIPQGVFPFPNFKRELLLPPTQNFASFLANH